MSENDSFANGRSCPSVQETVDGTTILWLNVSRKMSSQFLTAFLITVGAGLATSIGAAAVFFTTKFNYKFLAFGLAFSAGVMIYVSLVEILVKSYTSYTIYFNNDGKKGYAAATATLFGGILLTYCIDLFVHFLYKLTGVNDVHDHSLPNEQELPSDAEVMIESGHMNHMNGICICIDAGKSPCSRTIPSQLSPQASVSTLPRTKIESERLMGTALITAVAIGLHNFPVKSN